MSFARSPNLSVILKVTSTIEIESAHPNGILLADASPYLPDGFFSYLLLVGIIITTSKNNCI